EAGVGEDVGPHAHAAVAPGGPGVDEERLALGAGLGQRALPVVGDEAHRSSLTFPRRTVGAGAEERSTRHHQRPRQEGAVRRRNRRQGGESPTRLRHRWPSSPGWPPVGAGLIPGGIPLGTSVWSTWGMGGMRELESGNRVAMSASTKKIRTMTK